MIDKDEEHDSRPRGFSKSLDTFDRYSEATGDKKQSIHDLCKSTSSLSYTYEDPNLLEFNANVFWKTDSQVEDLEEID